MQHGVFPHAFKREISEERRPPTANKEDIALMAHLMRRGGFGATRSELESLAEQGYEEIVEQLLDPGSQPPLDECLLYRIHPITEMPTQHYSGGQPNWLYHMVNTERPLQEKMVLFWHHVFATSNDKVDNCDQLISQIEMFRRHGMGNYRELLVQLAKDPAMIFWLDNNENHKRAPNENWGRELLELFSLGVGNYTEQDVFECSRAFTGWTIGAKMPRYPYGRFPWTFEFRPEDHDYTEKTFLGQTGKFNGEDIIDIIVRQPACPRFISRHLYSFFVADESQVPSWHIEPPRNPEAIEVMSLVFAKSGYEIKPVLRTLFNSDFFKEAAWQKVKSPIELVVGTLRLTREIEGPHPRLEATASEAGYMGQGILAPPGVEGWHTGVEWISSGAQITRVNFVADRISNVQLAGVRDIVHRVASMGVAMTAEVLVERCLDEMGPLEVSETTRMALLIQAENEEAAYGATEDDDARLTGRISAVLRLIAAAPEYQLT
ncbi:MAG: DUF1800 domain-containing protein [Chloroflexi bacterium]|nr:DUF1800 domain-containing protein [Chloroflexota bacterium]